MKIFISGASGLVGGQFLKVFQEKGLDVIGSHLTFPTEETVFYNTLDVNHPDNFDLVNWAPDIIIHCGALTHVDYCENHIEESYEKTVQSTQNLINVANKIQAKLILLSTDYVFDGENGPYTETDKTNPLSVYGKHKLIAEDIVREHSENHLIIRITNVYGDEIRNKNFISRIITQYENNETIHLNLPIDQYATPTNANDIARATFELINANKRGIFHIASTDFMNRVELAKKVLRFLPSASFTLQTFTTSELQQMANRPLLGGLIAAKFKSEFPDFEFTNVDDYLYNYLSKEK